MSDAIKQLDIRDAMSRWKWSYRVGYLWAALNVVQSFALEDEAGSTLIGFDPLYTTVMLFLALIIGLLAWGLQKHLSIVCGIILLIFALLDAVLVLLEPEPSMDMIFSWVFAIFMFRGVLCVGKLKRFRNEMRQAQVIDDQVEGTV